MKPLSEVFEICVVPLDLFVFARTCARTVSYSSRPIGRRWSTSRGSSVQTPFQGINAVAGTG